MSISIERLSNKCEEVRQFNKTGKVAQPKYWKTPDFVKNFSDCIISAQ